MLMIGAVVRPSKTDEVLSALQENGFSSATRMDAYGRGKQKGIQIGEVFYDEIPKDVLLIVVEDDDKQKVVDLILQHARTGANGNFGDGRIFIHPVLEAYTIRTKEKGL